MLTFLCALSVPKQCQVSSVGWALGEGRCSQPLLEVPATLRQSLGLWWAEGDSWLGLRSPGPWRVNGKDHELITQRPNQTHVVQTHLQLPSAVRKLLAPITSLEPSLALGTDGLGESVHNNLLALPSRYGPPCQGGQHFFPVISVGAPGLTALGPGWLACHRSLWWAVPVARVGTCSPWKIRDPSPEGGTWFLER